MAIGYEKVVLLTLNRKILYLIPLNKAQRIFRNLKNNCFSLSIGLTDASNTTDKLTKTHQILSFHKIISEHVLTLKIRDVVF